MKKRFYLFISCVIILTSIVSSALAAVPCNHSLDDYNKLREYKTYKHIKSTLMHDCYTMYDMVCSKCGAHYDLTINVKRLSCSYTEKSFKFVKYGKNTTQHWKIQSNSRKGKTYCL